MPWAIYDPPIELPGTGSDSFLACRATSMAGVRPTRPTLANLDDELCRLQVMTGSSDCGLCGEGAGDPGRDHPRRFPHRLAAPGTGRSGWQPAHRTSKVQRDVHHICCTKTNFG